MLRRWSPRRRRMVSCRFVVSSMRAYIVPGSQCSRVVMCSLCGYRGQNIRRHMLSSAHVRGVSACIDSVRRLLLFRWVENEVSYQRGLGHRHRVHEERSEELSYTWTCDTRVMSLWSVCARWFSDLRRRDLRRGLGDLPDEVIREILHWVPECQPSYCRSSLNGKKNFQMLCLNMDRPRSPICTTSSVAMDLRSSACLIAGSSNPH